MKTNSLRLLFVAATLLYVGCSDPKAANDKNFAKAISAHLLMVEGGGRFCIGSQKYPEENLPYETKNHALAKAGLVQVTGHGNISIYTSDIFGLTAKGREAFTQGKGFCYGKPELIRIVNFTEPGSTGPYVMSRVTYLYRVRDIASWASESSGQVVEALRDLIPNPNAQTQDTQTFVLTGNGWVHESLARQ